MNAKELSNDEIKRRLMDFEALGRNTIWNREQLEEITSLAKECDVRRDQFEDFKGMYDYCVKNNCKNSPNENPLWTFTKTMLHTNFNNSIEGTQNLKNAVDVRCIVIGWYKKCYGQK